MTIAKHWRVEIFADGENIINIGADCCSGVPNIEDYADTVRHCAEHLMAFIGPEALVPNAQVKAAGIASPVSAANEPST